METTGGLSQKACGFCKEIRKRHESLNCHSTDGAYNNYEANPLQLQRANSRMILEKTPVLENLIESAMIKCEQAVFKKKNEAIESLRLERLRPSRINQGTTIKPVCKNIAQSFGGEGSAQKSCKANKEHLSGNKKTKSQLQSEGNGPSKGRQQGKPIEAPEKRPLNPKPPDGKKDNEESLRTESVVIELKGEERTLAPKPPTSQCPSTSTFSKQSHLSS